MHKVHNMRGATFIDNMKIDCFAWQNECTGALLALHANNRLNGTIFYNSRIFLQTSKSALEFVSKQPNTVDLFEILNWHISAWKCCPRSLSASIPTSIVPRLCFPSISVSVLSTTNYTVGLPAQFQTCVSGFGPE